MLAGYTLADSLTGRRARPVEQDTVARQALLALVSMAPGELVPRLLLHYLLINETVTTDAAELAISRLENLGLLTQDTEGELRVHRLIAAYVRTTSDQDSDAYGTEIVNRLFEYGRAAYDRTDIRTLASIERHIRWVTDSAIPLRSLEAAHWADFVGNSLAISGDFVGGNFYLGQSCAIAEEILGPDDPRLALYLNDLGHTLAPMGKNEDAIRHFERAAPLWERAGDLPNLAATLDNLGNAMMEVGRDAREVLAQALTIRTSIFGPNDMRVATTLHSLGRYFLRADRLQQARQYLNEALRISEAQKRYWEVSRALATLASLSRKAGELTDALSYLKRAVSIQRGQLGMENPLTQATLWSLIRVYLALEDIEGLLPWSQEIAEGGLDETRADDWNTAGYLAWAAGDFWLALARYGRALESMRSGVSSNSGVHRAAGPTEALLLNNLGMARLGLDEFGEAVALFQRALAHTEDRNLRARIRNNLGVALSCQSSFAMARSELRNALVERRALYGDIHHEIFTTVDNLGMMWLRSGDLTRASENLRSAYHSRRQHSATRRIEISKSLHNLGDLATARRDDDEARHYYTEALEIRIECIPDHPETATTLICLGELGQALQILLARFGPAHPRTIHVERLLKSI